MCTIVTAPDFILIFEGALPPSSEHIDEAKGLKIITDFKYNDDNKMVKVTISVLKANHKVSYLRSLFCPLSICLLFSWSGG